MFRAARSSVLIFLTACAAACGFASSRQPARIERVVLLGFDGASLNLIEPLLAKGELPAIRRLIDEGSHGRLKSFRPAKSGVLWTSVATGKTMLKHGILDWTYVSETGLRVPYHDAGRRVKTYWEILSERGVKTGTLNWWVSYPPPPIQGGYLVSNAFRKRQQPETVYPSHLFDRLNPLRVTPDAAPAEMKRQGFALWRAEEATVPLGSARSVLESFPIYFAHDVTVDRASDYLWKNHPVQVFSTYFRLPDVMSHFAAHFIDPEVHKATVALEQAGQLGPEAMGRIDGEMAAAVAPAYRFMDRIVAKYLARVDERTLLIVCSDHGFAYFRGGYNHYNPAMEPPDGVIFINGPGVKKGYRIRSARLFDLAPTILHVMGHPVAEDMDGTFLSEAFEAPYVKAHPPGRIASYETTPRAQAAPGPNSHRVDEEVLEDLRTLGYIAVPTPSGTPGAEEAP